MSRPEADDANAVRRALVAAGVVAADATLTFEPLTGGVSSDIWRVEGPNGAICVKRARARLKVAALWEAPVERSHYEARWLETVGAVCPGAAPHLLGHEPEAGVLAMSYLAPNDYPLWKDRLLAGDADAKFAGTVGRRLGEIHARTAGRPEIRAAFPSDAIFYAIRLEPYLLATAALHKDLAARLTSLAESTAATRKALVHGDASPKNILIGPEGPVFLDAECAWYGDPAFDVAFCLNHLLLKSVWRPDRATSYLDCFDGLTDGYDATISWETRTGLWRRVSALLPALFLARVDGKSPVEYLVTDSERAIVRSVATTLLRQPVETPHAVRTALLAELCAGG